MIYQVLTKVRNNWNSHQLLVGLWNGAAPLENSWTVFIQLSTHLPYESAIPPLGIYYGELKMYVHMKTCTWMWTEAPFAMTKAENNSVPLSGWVDKLWDTMVYYSAIKSNKLLICVATWIDLKDIMLSERSSLKRFHTVEFNFYDILEKRRQW